MPTLADELSLADLEAFDPRAPERGQNRRFCCPLCGADKPRDAAHRSLTVEADSGAWNCHRCHARGKVTEHWEKRERRDLPEGGSRRSRFQRQARQAFEVPPLPVEEPSRPLDEKLLKRLRECVPLDGTPGEAYLASRGIPLAVAKAARVKYAPAWEHWEQDERGGWKLLGTSRRVVFPVYDRAGVLVGFQTRAISEADAFDRKSETRGLPGVFLAPVEAGQKAPEAVAAFLKAEGPALLVEAPIDALSLAACGHAAAATMGCNLPAWLPKALAFREVLIGTDADQAGDDAARKWKPALQAHGARPERMRPSGAKDWNELLKRHAAELKAALDGALSRSEGTADSLPHPAAPTWSDADQAEAEAAIRAMHERVAAGSPGAEAPTLPESEWAAAIDAIDLAHASQDLEAVRAACAAYEALAEREAALSRNPQNEPETAGTDEDQSLMSLFGLLPPEETQPQRAVHWAA